MIRWENRLYCWLNRFDTTGFILEKQIGFEAARAKNYLWFRENIALRKYERTTPTLYSSLRKFIKSFISSQIHRTAGKCRRCERATGKFVLSKNGKCVARLNPRCQACFVQKQHSIVHINRRCRIVAIEAFHPVMLSSFSVDTGGDSKIRNKIEFITDQERRWSACRPAFDSPDNMRIGDIPASAKFYCKQFRMIVVVIVENKAVAKGRLRNH